MFLRKENNELAIICRSPFQVLCAIEYLRSNIIEDYMGHRTKRILRIERKEYQTY